MKVYKDILYHPWYWLALPLVEIYYRPNTGGRWKDAGIHVGFLCYGFHLEIGQTRPWDNL
jgi:hypothetical protein